MKKENEFIKIYVDKVFIAPLRGVFFLIAAYFFFKLGGVLIDGEVESKYGQIYTFSGSPFGFFSYCFYYFSLGGFCAFMIFRVREKENED